MVLTKRRAVALCTVVATFAVGGCSSSSNSAGSTPSATTASPTSSGVSVPPSSSSTAPPPAKVTSLPPLSPYEKLPQVVGVRAFEREYAKAVNAGSESYGPLVATFGPALKNPANRKWLFGTDLKKHLHYPGPVPMTPTGVSGNKVFGCVWSTGFATDAKTGVPPEPRKIETFQFWMVKNSRGKYVVNAMYSAPQINCSKYKVVGRAW